MYKRQAQEIALHLKTSGRKKGVALLRDRKDAALALKDYLQDVFQETHHLDLEELREDEQTAGKVAMSLQALGLPGARTSCGWPRMAWCPCTARS